MKNNAFEYQILNPKSKLRHPAQIRVLLTDCHANYCQFSYMLLKPNRGATENARPENAGLENDGQHFSKL